MSRFMTSQQLADELARIAGWKYEPDGWWVRGDDRRWKNEHPFPVGSIDALEAFRRERLPGWQWWNVGWQQDRVEAGMVHQGTQRLIKKYGPDEWTARASALIAAVEAIS